jgi:extracellular factor (EF) 3-hydroxypalmitic acid methyl ester biosynthesis protein
LEIRLSNQRKYDRSVQDSTFCIVQDIDTPFIVVEISAHGFSFACEKGDGRFSEGTELSEISVLNGTSQEIIHATGTIVHRSEFDSNQDRIGVHFVSKRLDNTMPGAVRLPRRQAATELTVRLNVDGKTHAGKVLDYNVSSVRIETGEPSALVAGQGVDVEIATGTRTVFEGRGTVVRLGEDNREIVVRFDTRLLDVNAISVLEKAVYAKEMLQIADEKLKRFDVIRPEYKAFVEDWRMYLSSARKTLDQEERKGYLTSEDSEVQYIKEIEPVFESRMRHHISQLNSLAPEIEPELLDLHKEFLRLEIEEFLRRAPILCSIIDKVRGYAGDYETVRQFFANPYRGSTTFGKLLNNFIISLEPVRAHIARIDFLYQEILSHYQAAENQLRILSLGSGPAEEVLRFIQNHDSEIPVHITLIDGDAYALADFFERYQYIRSNNIEVHLVNYNAISILVNQWPDVTPGSYDMVYCAGMYDYFKDRFCRKFTNFLINLTKPGGQFYFTNVHSRNFARYFMDFGGGWEIYHRDEEQTANLAPEEYPREVILDETETNIYVKATKIATAQN